MQIKVVERYYNQEFITNIVNVLDDVSSDLFDQSIEKISNSIIDYSSNKIVKNILFVNSKNNKKNVFKIKIEIYFLNI